MTFSQPEIFGKIKRASKAAARSMPDDEEVVGVLGCHLTLYDARSQVFHAAISALHVSGEGPGQKPKRLVLLIDDIYDMFDELNGEGDIFDSAMLAEMSEENLIEAAVRALPKDEKRLPGNSVAGNSLFALDAEVSALQRLLAWRRAEMIAAESLAEDLSVPLFLIGVKHPIEILRSILCTPSPDATYISHPITRHRVERGMTGRWSEDVRNLNRLPLELAERGVTGIMPTAIDELRFSPPTVDDIWVRSGGLAPRWPSMASDFRLISPRYEPLQTEHAGINSASSALASDPRIASASLRTVEAAAYWEIPYRDHYLVNHCRNLLVFRPQEAGNTFSGGVLSEIQFFERLAGVQDRRMAIIHDSDDISLILERIARGDLIDEDLPLRVVSKYIKANGARMLHRNLTEADRTKLARGGTLAYSQLSQRTHSRANLDALLRSGWLAAAQVVLFRELSGLDGERPWCRILIGDTGETGVLTAAAAWLTSINTSEPLEPMLASLAEHGALLNDDSYSGLALSLATTAGVDISDILK